MTSTTGSPTTDMPPSDTPADLAARLRATRARLVSSIAAGDVRLEDLLADTDAAGVKAVVLAEAVPGLGKVRARKILEALGIAESARWGEVDRQAVIAAVATAGGASPAAEQ